MNNKIIYITVLFISLFSCRGLVDDINDNPNGITIDEIDASQFITGAMLANTIAQAGHLNRVSGLYSGQLQGISSLYANIYGYDISTAESITTWSRIYIGVVPNVRHIRSISPNNKLFQGMSKVLEAHAVGTGASLFGDVPYSEINTEGIDDPKFDGQKAVFTALIGLLDEAIADLNGVGSQSVSADIYYGGDGEKWRAAAYTLKARYLMHLRDYAGAYAAAQNGISSYDGNMQHIPTGDPSISSGDKNLFWEVLEGSRAGDIGSGESHLSKLLSPESDLYRGNDKTDETARGMFMYINAASGSDNAGIIEQFEPQNLISYEENQLTLAEAGLRTSGFSTGLTHLNEFRAWLNTGGRINANFSDQPYKYEAYAEADFASGGIENSGSLSKEDALLREIIEERYVSGFGQYMPFDDARRIRNSGDASLGVQIPFNVASASVQPERLPYSDDELNSNSNAPAQDPGIFTKTEVNN